ncbi:MAG: type I-C CRISPR-associated protein Cas7/Csd2 [Spirochaetaceae bacterium]|jgi:CRISPR-associated protein Csd2|nr:type I-C CRISPR-associated protein Cas7/Csd2 [Spirochaetaceae bacterium]
MELKNRYDFIYLFDVKDGNPNGDPDAGNLPRIDAETGNGLVTDVCLKRKVRNYIGVVKEEKPPYDIYIKEKAVLGRSHIKAFNELGISLGEDARKPVPTALRDALEYTDLPNGMTLEEDDEDLFLVVSFDADIPEIKKQIKGMKLPKEITNILNDVLKSGKFRKPTSKETDKGREWMCKHFYDIRTFGAVMSLKSAPNCGQVRGPVQLTFARSIDPVITFEYSITRMAVATEKEAEKQSGDNRTMGRKFTVPYGLYRTYGFISAPLANQTGFSMEDLSLFWEALQNMFEHDRSAARGLMSAQRLIIFEHASRMGNKPVQELFNRVGITRKYADKPVRDFSDYSVCLDGKELDAFQVIVSI